MTRPVHLTRRSLLLTAAVASLAPAAACTGSEADRGTHTSSQVTVLADTGDGWQALLTERDAVSATVDMRRPDTLGGHRYAWGSRPDSGKIRLSGVRAGLFGMAGIRDQHLVQHADGTPYVRDGLLLADHAGQVVRDDEEDRWIVATSSWGDFAFDGVHVRHVVTADDVLSGVHVLETEPTPLPTDVSA